MNWDAIGAIGEILGAIGVIVTLLYLTTQIRQNTKAIHSSTRSSWLEAIQTTNQISISTPENAEIWHRGSFLSEDLEGKDFTVYVVQISAFLNAFESLFLEHQAGNVDSDFLQSKLLTMKWLFRNPAALKAWEIWEESQIGDPGFTQYVRSKLLSRDA